MTALDEVIDRVTVVDLDFDLEKEPACEWESCSSAASWVGTAACEVHGPDPALFCDSHQQLRSAFPVVTHTPLCTGQMGPVRWVRL